LPNDAEHAGFLSAEEKYLVILRKNREVGQTLSAQKYHRADVKKAFTSWQNWAFYCAQFGCGTMLYGYSTFLPTIIKGLGTWTSPEVQALTIPCYTLGAIAYLIVAYLSDRYQQRGLFVVLFGIISIIGYALLISPVSNGVHYFACFVVATGLYVLVGLPLAWLPSNAPRYGKRTAGTGMQLTIGTASGIMSSFIYPTAEGPRFIKGHTITMAMVAFSTCVFAFMTWWFTKTNKNRAEGKEDYKIVGLTDAEIEELGDES
jgi:MFS family permease